MPGYTACTACPAHAAQASHSSPHFGQFSASSRVCASHPNTPWKQNTCSQQPGMPGYTACTACPAHAAQPVLHQLPNLHLAPHQTLEAEHLQLAARHARLYSLHSLSSPRSPDQSQFPTCQAVRQLPNLHLKPHQTLEAEHLQLAARHARLYSLHSLCSPRSPGQSQFPTFQPVLHQLPNCASRPITPWKPNTCSQHPGMPGYTACTACPAHAAQPVLHQLPNLHLKPHQTSEAEHLQLAARHARLYSLHSLSSPRSPDQSQFPTC